MHLTVNSPTRGQIFKHQRTNRSLIIVFHPGFQPKKTYRGVWQGDSDFTGENARRLTPTGNKCCSLCLLSVENIFLDPNWSRMLIGFKLTLFGCPNTSKSFHAAWTSCTNIYDSPTGSIVFISYFRPVADNDRQANAYRVQTKEVKYVEGTPHISGQ